MRIAQCGLLLITVAFGFAARLMPQSGQAAGDPPVWAYGTDPAIASHAAAQPPDHSPKHLPGAGITFTLAQIQDPFAPADWFPHDHPAMPDVVAHGRKPDIWACALCHYPNGKGKPENASVAGFPPAYFIEQMHEFRDDQRKSADARKTNTGLMIKFAKSMTDREIEQAAAYYGSMNWTSWIKVVETDTVPKTRTSVGMYMPVPGGGTEPIRQRIIEVPLDPEGTEQLRNPRSGFVAYVPIGSVEKGKQLVTASGGRAKTAACAVCHGPDLTGLGPVPGIAGRSPSYLVRQLYDMQQGTRKGPWTALMKSVVASLSQQQMLEIAAYTSSLAP